MKGWLHYYELKFREVMMLQNSGCVASSDGIAIYSAPEFPTL